MVDTTVQELEISSTTSTEPTDEVLYDQRLLM